MDFILYLISIKQRGIKKLDLSKKGLAGLPPQIGQLTNLTSLNLRYNQLRTLPPEITQLTNLKKLDLSYNQLSALPPEIEQLTNLKKLDLSYNQLSALPLERWELSNLLWLDLSGNLLRTLPPQIEQLINLRWLNLSDNQLNSLPLEIGELSTLTMLNARHNQLSTLPLGIKRLTSLKILDLRDNLLLIPNNILSILYEPYTIFAYYYDNFRFMENMFDYDKYYFHFYSYKDEDNVFFYTEKTIFDFIQEKTQEILQYRESDTTKKQLYEYWKTGIENLSLKELKKYFLIIKKYIKNSRKTIKISKKKIKHFPTEICLINTLIRINLSDNEISGLPPQIGQLSNLTTLDLGGNQLSTLPSEIGQLSNLTTLDLGSNQLSTLPSEIGQLTKLRNLDLNGNQLYALPLEIKQLRNLTTLDLRNNLLPIPLELIERTKKPAAIIEYYYKLFEPIKQAKKGIAKKLELSRRGLTKLPSEIVYLTHLISLDLSENKLRTLPPKIGQLSNLTTLKLSSNKFSVLPSQIEQLNHLTTLDLSNNQLSWLPSQIERLNHLTILDLSNNQLSWLSLQIVTLNHLTTLDLSNNKLSTLPPQIGELNHLTTLDLSNNQLSTLPPELDQLTNLTTLDLRDNPLPIPLEILKRIGEPDTILKHYRKTIGLLEQAREEIVTKLDLSKKGLIRLPSEIGQLTHLMKLDLHNNLLLELPQQIGQLANLTSLVLYGNQLKALPSGIGQLTNLTTLYLYDNKLRMLPQEIGKLANLITLYLYNNELRGLPSSIGQLTNLTTLDLSGNQLSALPSQIGQLTNLKWLDLSGNQLSALPPQIGQLTNLKWLDLSGNQLVALPEEIIELKNLKNLYLTDNKLRRLPTQIKQLTGLITLDLCNNPLFIPHKILAQTSKPSIIIEYYINILYNIKKAKEYGMTVFALPQQGLTRLPLEISQLTNLVSLDLSGNRIETLAPEIGQLASITSLDLNGNQLSTLPLEIGLLTNLTALDLRNNQLVALPLSISRLTNLTTLDLRYNQLPIPPEILERTDSPTTIIEYYKTILLIKESVKNEMTELDLSKKELTRLPSEIGQLTSLTKLDLSDNLMNTLPLEIGSLTNLIQLHLQDNQLSILPSEIGLLSNLISLDMRHNSLSTLPSEIGNLTNLSELDLSGNQLSTLPAEISLLTNLTILDLRNNQLSIPPEILEQTDSPATIIEYYKIIEKIEEARKNEEAELNLDKMKMKIVPPLIGQLKPLVKLELRRNQLSILPAEIGQLTNLTKLDIVYNELSKLPSEIRQLTNLTLLNLFRNRLSLLPAEIGLLTNLTYLNLSNNQLSTLPAEIGQLANLTQFLIGNNKLSRLPSEIGQLTNLTELDIHNNQLSKLPMEIGQLINLISLKIGHNKVTILPVEIGQLINLTTLNLASNQLRTLPLEIGRLTNLTILNLSDNQLKTLPTEIGQLTNLTELNLSNNQLTTIPLEIWQLTKLTKLDLRHNQLSIPPEILESTNEPNTIIEYYLRERIKPLNEAKLVLVGQGAVGKTSLVKRLVEGKFNEHEPMTEGINIKQWHVNVNGEAIKLNIWDFGGQEIMHATHQFFLTQRTVYLLVLDARQGEVSSRLDYWLELIQSFAASSPIIVVSNKIDQHQLPLNQRELTEKYPNIKAFVNISCVTGEGIAELKRKITFAISELEHVRDLIPLEWLGIKTELKEIGQNYIAYSEYVRRCQVNDIRNEKKQRLLIRLLHDLGVVLNFEDDPLLRKTIILNPEWVTNAVSQIINTKPLQNQGVLLIGQLTEILEPDVYPKEKYLLIIEMMRRFELYFDLEGYIGEKFLIPDLLSPQSSALDFWPDDSLNFEYHYFFLPDNIILRFMVQMHGFIFAENHWRTGIILVKDKNNALVRAIPEKKKITISIIGPPQRRRQFLTDIRSKFEQIHQAISNIKAVEYVVYENVAIRYSDLKRFHEEGIEYQHFLDSHDELVIVDVEELLNQVKWESSEQEDWEIRKLLRKLRRQLHPQLFYSSALSLGKAHYKEGAYTLARQAFAVTHQALRALRGMESTDEALVRLSRESAELYQMLVHCCVEEQNYVRAFEYAAIGKGRAFVNTLFQARFDFEALGLQEGFAEKLAEAQKLRDKIEEEISKLAHTEDHNLRGEQYKLFQQEIELWREMEREYPRLTAMLKVPTLSTKQVHNLAKELDAMLVEYYCHAGGWCAFVVTGDQIRYIALPTLKKKLLKQLIRWRNKVHLPAGRSSERHKRLAELYDAAIAPLGQLDERIIIAPFQELHLVPLAAAYNQHTQSYLAEEHVLSFAPSLTALHVLNQQPEQDALSQKGIKKLLSVAYPGKKGTAHYLPNVLPEAEAIIKWLSKVAKVDSLHEVDPLHEKAATPDNVLKRAVNYDAIHFGCHGWFDSDNPTQSGLLLAGEKPYLTVQDIITQLNLKQTRLVTLAACLSGQVALQAGEEHIGLLQALMTAGVPSVVASLWLVDDAATRALFTAFYTRQININAPAQAMRDAGSLLRGKENWAHPYYWAAFQVNGLTEPLSRTREEDKANESPPIALSPHRPLAPSADAVRGDERGIQWPPDLLEQIDQDYQRSFTNQRGEEMKDQHFVDNAEVLFEDMLSAEGTLAALKQYPLPDEMAGLEIEKSELGIADAIHHIVLNNPTLRQRFLPSSVRDIELLKAQLRELRARVSKKQHDGTAESSRSNEEVGQQDNDIPTVRRGLIETLKGQASSSDDQNDGQGDWRAFVAKLLRGGK